MNIKINWGWGVVIALASFMIFIGTIVFQLMFKKEYNHQLVSETYYKDELVFQLELNKIKNGEKLFENVKIKNENGNITIIFPTDMDFSKIEGTAYFQYVMEEKYDFEQKIELKSNLLEIDSTRLKKGTYRVKIDWKYQDVSYLLKDKIIY